MNEGYNGMPVKAPFQKGTFFAGILTGILVVSVIGAGVFLGTKLAHRNDANGAAEAVSASGTETYDSVLNSRSRKKIRQILQIVDEHYLNEVTQEELEEGLYRGIIEALDDKYAEYYNEKEYQDLIDSNQGVFYGIGAYISIDEDTQYPYFKEIMEGTPAEAGGLQAKDYIMKVDGEDMKGFELKEVTSRVKGPEGTEVTLTIKRKTKEFEVTITRAKVNTPTVKYDMKDGDIGYIKITEFDSVTVSQFETALNYVYSQNAKGLVIDLRNNGGGLLDACCDIARMMLPKGTILYTLDKNDKKVTYDCDGKNEIQIPVVMLVNGSSASASEVLTGAMKDHEKATVVGTTTFGKGIVQRIYDLKDDTAIKLTISAYYTPNGISIHGTGIEPDVKVELDEDAYVESDGEEDNQLDKAIEVLRGKIR